MTMSISRCTQNPTFMEEWRKGWHPEKMNTKGGSNNVLVVGSGPAGLEAARGRCVERGYDVAIAEAGTEIGGRVARERKLPGSLAPGAAWWTIVNISSVRNLMSKLISTANWTPRAFWNLVLKTFVSPPAQNGVATVLPVSMSCRCRSRRAPTSSPQTI